MNYHNYICDSNKPDGSGLYQVYSIRFEEYKDYSELKPAPFEQYIIILIFLMRRRYQYFHLKTGEGGERK